MNKVILFVIFIIAVLNNGCNNQINESKLYGGYYLNTDPLADSLFLYKNQKYEKKHLSASGQLYITRGTWHLDITTNSVEFEKFSFNGRGSGGLWISRVELEDSKIRLIYADDSDIAYIKK